MHWASFDRHMMTIALRMARRGLGQVAPNPAVGAVLADPRTGEVIARGWTQPGGRPHAETEALRRAGSRARGATLYVTLEPCAHHGVTPPCADAIVAAGVARVVVGIVDPDPRTAGQGIARLAAAGIAVETGCLGEEARRITLGHILRVTERRPFVQLKLALATDGSVPQGANGRPVWATGAEARARGHLMRVEADAILVGIGTVLADDPELTCRLPGLGTRPLDRVVIDSRLRTPLTAKVLPKTGDSARVWIATCTDERAAEASGLRQKGARILTGLGGAGGASARGRVDLGRLLGVLAEKGVTRLLVEGGPEIWRAFAEAGFADEAVIFQAGPAQEEGAVRQALDRLLPNAPMRLAESRRIGEDTMHVFRSARSDER